MKIIAIAFIVILSLGVKAQENQKKKSPKQQEKKFRPVAIPTVSANRSRGLGLGLLAMGFFKFYNDEDTPPSRIGLAGNYTTKDNYSVILFEQFFLRDDHWRINSAQILANSNFQTYLSAPRVESTFVIPYNNYFKMFYLNLEKKIVDKLFFGPQVTVGSADTRFEPDKFDDQIVEEDLNSVGLTITYDTTKNKYNSTDGETIRLLWNDYPEWFDNASDFGSFNFQANWYRRQDDTKVLATRASAYYAYGDVPFVGERFVGNNDIRGYTTGQYRGDQVYAAQTELRWNFHSLWGSVFFAGLAMTKEKEDWSNLLPGVGTGLRYLLIKEQGINAGLDYAVGNADWGVYFRITEAF